MLKLVSVEQSSVQFVFSAVSPWLHLSALCPVTSRHRAGTPWGNAILGLWKGV